MLAETARSLALVALLALAGPALADPSTAGALTAVEDAARGLERARIELLNARSESDELAHRITALKRVHARGTDAALAPLLLRSVAVERGLEERAKARDAARGRLEQAVGAAVRAIDDAIRAAKPELKSSDPERRAAAARRLKALLADRERARAQLARGDDGERGTPKAWAQYEVRVEALDGPGELREKADFVEDTRDKLRKKREALERLVAEARQEREIARATVNFRTEVGLFDEQSRAGRVAKSGARANTLADAAPAAPTRAASSGGSGNETPSDPAAVAAPGFQGSPPPEAGRGADDSGAEATAAAPRVVAVSPSAAPLPKTVDAAGLVNLDLRTLGATDDVGTLEALLADLARLDGYLGERASSIRSRAEKLEADEATALKNR